MKILQVSKLYPPVIGGIEKFVRLLSELLSSKEADISVLVCQKKGWKSVEFHNKIKITRSTSYGIFLSMPLSISFIIDFIKESKANDIVHIHMPFPLADLALFLSRYKGKVVLSWHSDIVRQKKLMFFYKPLMKWTLNRADKIIAATQGNIIHSEILVHYRGKCEVIPFCVDPDLMINATAYNQSMYPNKKDSYNFLYVGRFVYYKGCEILLKAFAYANLTNAKLTLVGNGPLYSDLIKLANDLNISHKVIFKTNLKDVDLYKEYAECNVFVLPSTAKSEAFGLVQIEAMAYGKPVINTKLESGVPYVGINEETGLTVEPRNHRALGEAMKELYYNTDKAIEMGSKARKIVLEKYRCDSMLEKIYELYNYLILEDE